MYKCQLCGKNVTARNEESFGFLSRLYFAAELCYYCYKWQKSVPNILLQRKKKKDEDLKKIGISFPLNWINIYIGAT